MNLRDIPDDMKIKTFDVIVDYFYKDTLLNTFGKDVSDTLKVLSKLYAKSK